VRALAALGAEAWGVEQQQSKLHDARSGGGGGRRLSGGDIERLAFAEAVFDLALLNEVLEHVPDDRRALDEVYRVLRPGGLLLVFSPNRLYPFETHGVFLRRGERRLPAYVPFVPWLPLPVSRRLLRPWARNYWPWELRGLLRESGFVTLRSAWLGQTFENISRRQPRLVGALRPLLRACTSLLERTPLLRSFGASQVLLARKPAGGAEVGRRSA
jgi:SAM-dependent methyltransferase